MKNSKIYGFAVSALVLASAGCVGMGAGDSRPYLLCNDPVGGAPSPNSPTEDACIQNFFNNQQANDAELDNLYNNLCKHSSPNYDDAGCSGVMGMFDHPGAKAACCGSDEPLAFHSALERIIFG